jgi:adenosylcobinamide kinase/adenosylcobinamide-phosphate guanylyltransferase
MLQPRGIWCATEIESDGFTSRRRSRLPRILCRRQRKSPISDSFPSRAWPGSVASNVALRRHLSGREFMLGKQRSMNRVLLITGGVRSGKSAYAEKRALALGPRLVYLATARPIDTEMRRRIEEHRKRRGDIWRTVEEPLEVPRVLQLGGNRMDCVLIDCVTVWLSNLLLERGEAEAEGQVRELGDWITRTPIPLILVTNEVGSGIIPANPLARQFSDLAGRANQRLAELAAEVVLMVSGIPVTIKPAGPTCA